MSEATHLLGLPLKHKLKEIKPTDYNFKDKVCSFESNGTMYDVYGDPTYGLIIEERSTGIPAILLGPNGIIEVYNYLRVHGTFLGVHLAENHLTLQDGINDIFSVYASGNALIFKQRIPTIPPQDYEIFRLVRGSDPYFQIKQDMLPHNTEQLKLGSASLRFLEIHSKDFDDHKAAASAHHTKTTSSEINIQDAGDVDKTAIGDDKILVYKTLSGKHEYEVKGAPSAHASTHETLGTDKVHFADLERDDADPTLHDAFTSAPHISQDEKDKIHDRLHALSSSLDHSGEITDAQHGTKTTIPNAHHNKLHASTHADGGADEITSPLDLAAIPNIHQSQNVKGTTDISTTSTSFVDMSEMSITMTTGNNPVLILFSCSCMLEKSDVGAYMTRLLIDDVTEAGARESDNSKIGAYGSLAICHLKTLSAASHVIKVQWCVVGVGTVTVRNRPASYPNFDHRILTVIELKK